MNKLVVRVLDKEYKVGFPNVGQMLDIETNKMILSSGKYHEMVESSVKGVASSIQSLDLIDALSTLSVMIPDLKKHISYEDGEIDLKTGLILTNVYKVVYFPWFNEIQKDILAEVERVNKEINELNPKKS